MLTREKFTNMLIKSNPVSHFANKMINKKKDKFTNDGEEYGIVNFIGMIGFVFALYLWFTCNAGKPFGSFVMEFILAFFCWPIYILYVGISRNWCSKPSVTVGALYSEGPSTPYF